MGRLGNTPAQLTNFFLDRAKSYAFDMFFEMEGGGPYDLTGSDVRIVVRQLPHNGGGMVLTGSAEHIDAPMGQVQFQFQAADLDLEPAEYPYDVTFLANSGFSTPTLKGSFHIGDNADDNTSNVYHVPVGPSCAFTATIGNGCCVKVCLNSGYGDGAGAEEVWVGPNSPPLRQEMWVDTDEPDPSLQVPDEVWVGDEEPPARQELWVDTLTPSYVIQPDEVWVGDEEPPTRQQLWVDTDEPDPVYEPPPPVAGGYYRHDQAMPSNVWIIQHDLGYRPAVNVQDQVGNVMYGSVQHLSTNLLEIRFMSSYTGSAHCS